MAYYLIGLILLYVVSTIPGFIMFSQGKKLQGAFAIIIMITIFMCLFFMRSESLFKSYFSLLALLWLFQIFYLLFLFINKSKKETKGVKEISFLDVIKGLLFIGFLFVAYFLSGSILVLTSLIIAQYKELISLQGPVLFILLLASIIAGIVGFGVLTGRPLWMLWKSNISKNSKDDVK